MREYGERPGMILVCGRYEGVDERVRAALIDEEISIGDYVSRRGDCGDGPRGDGGPPGPGRGRAGRVGGAGLLLRRPPRSPALHAPAVFRGLAVPAVLLSGDHAAITRWRRREALRQTLRKRPELLAAAALDAEDLKLLEQIRGRVTTTPDRRGSRSPPSTTR